MSQLRTSALRIGTRRIVLSSASLILILASSLSLAACSRSAVADKTGQPASWSIKVVPENEPGEPLIVSGTIYSPDGKQPLEGITLYVYQTDATGVYTTSGGDNRGTRIHGVMRTNAQGQYEFRTIKPGSYPNSRNPAHIHAYVSGPGYPEYWIDEYLFADDPFIKDEDKQKASGQGAFSPILTPTRGADGILRAVRNIRIERCTRNCTGR
jgi:protocatechuate 3,4-dioxygenase, beta subunit